MAATMATTSLDSPMTPLRKSSIEQSTAAAHGSHTSHSPHSSLSTHASHATHTAISSKPTLITTPHLKFLIMDAPRQANLHLYIKELKRHFVTDVVRVCEPTYLGSELKSAGMELHEMAYEDGQSPPDGVLDAWLGLVEERFYGPSSNTGTGSTPPAPSSANGGAGVAGGANKPTIAVHCVAGLGRAPVLVAIALIEFENMDALEAVTMIRRNRRGAINEKQLQYLQGYKRRWHRKRGGGEGGCACVVM